MKQGTNWEPFSLTRNPVDLHMEPDNYQPCIIWVIHTTELCTQLRVCVLVHVCMHLREGVYLCAYLCNCLFVPHLQKQPPSRSMIVFRLQVILKVAFPWRKHKPPESDSSALQQDGYHHSNTSLQGPTPKLHFQKCNSSWVWHYLNDLFRTAVYQSMVCRQELPKLANLFNVHWIFWQRHCGGHCRLDWM